MRSIADYVKDSKCSRQAGNDFPTLWEGSSNKCGTNSQLVGNKRNSRRPFRRHCGMTLQTGYSRK